MTKTILFGGILLAGLFLAVVSFDDAYAAAYIKFDGVDGESKDDKHDKWIDVLSIDWGIHRGDIGMSITKPIDKASPKLMEAVCQGKKCTPTNATFEVCRATGIATDGKSEPQCYLKYELKKVIVTSYRVDSFFDVFTEISVSGETQPTEQISLNFEEIKVTYIPFDENGREGPPVTGFYEKGNKAAG